MKDMFCYLKKPNKKVNAPIEVHFVHHDALFSNFHLNIMHTDIVHSTFLTEVKLFHYHLINTEMV